MRSLVNDPHGTALWIEREARGMDPMQMFRELVQNGIEAGANRIIIDGYTDPQTGQRLARITDNGHGMTGELLVQRMSQLHSGTNEKNYGVGARIASLPFNTAGVEFASRTAAGEETSVTLCKERGRYGVKIWGVVDEDGDEVKTEEVAPDPGVLARLPLGASGTAVILRGDGKTDTWNPSRSYGVHKFLSRRYYDLGAGVTVLVEQPDGDNKRGFRLRSITSMGEYLAGHSFADGEVPFSDVAGLSGSILWWVLPPGGDMRQKMGTRAVLPGGVGLLVDSEVFDYSPSYLGDFGVIYPSVQHRVALLIRVTGAEQDTARAGVILPGGSRKTMPWKKVGTFFADIMPAAINELLSQVHVRPAVLDSALADALDPEWFKNLNPIRVHQRAKTGEPLIGEGAGVGVPPKEPSDAANRSDGGTKAAKRTARDQTGGSGDNPGSTRLKVVTPQVEFISEWDDDAHPLGVTWFAASNKILIWDQFFPYRRDVARWQKQVPAVSKSIVEAAVQSAYAIEFAATIIDANAQAKWGLAPEQIDELKTDGALYAKVLGMQSLTARIEQFIRDAAKAA